MLSIKPLTQENLEAVSKIEKQSHTFPWTDKILESNFGQRYFNFVLLKGNEIVGYYFANQVAGEASLLNIAIAPEYQGDGYGKFLLEHVIAQCEERNLLQLWLEVRESNLAAYHLYLNSGFNEVDRRIGYYPAKVGREDAIMMCYIV